MIKQYLAVLDSPTRLLIVDAQSGIRVNYINVGYNIVNGPIITGDKCTIIMQKSAGTKFGRIYKLPSGSLINQFQI
jgi:hypothetical protein